MNDFLSSSERSELLDELRRERSRKYAERLKTILLLDSGKSAKSIAEYLFLDEGTVRNWQKRWFEGGIEKLINDHYIGRVSLLSDKEQEKLSIALSSRVFSTTKEIVYFADSTHPTLNPKLGYGWIKKGEEFEIKTNSGRQRVNINGAIEINTLDVVSRSCKSSNHQSICELLRAIRQKNPKEDKIYVVLDNAPYNRSWIIRSCARDLKIRLVYLPPYSPNLNPIERLWKYMKKKVMANRYYENLSEFQEAISNFFRSIRGQKKNYPRSLLTTSDFAVPENSNPTSIKSYSYGFPVTISLNDNEVKKIPITAIKSDFGTTRNVKRVKIGELSLDITEGLRGNQISIKQNGKTIPTRTNYSGEISIP